MGDGRIRSIHVSPVGRPHRNPRAGRGDRERHTIGMTTGASDLEIDTMYISCHCVLVLYYITLKDKKQKLFSFEQKYAGLFPSSRGGGVC